MSRSSKKGAFVEPSLMKKALLMQQQKVKKPIKTWSRASTIYPEFVGLNFMIHNGKNFINIYVNEHMIGNKLGDFALTRIFKGHAGKKGKNDHNKKGKK